MKKDHAWKLLRQCSLSTNWPSFNYWCTWLSAGWLSRLQCLGKCVTQPALKDFHTILSVGLFLIMAKDSCVDIFHLFDLLVLFHLSFKDSSLSTGPSILVSKSSNFFFLHMPVDLTKQILKNKKPQEIRFKGSDFQIKKHHQRRKPLRNIFQIWQTLIFWVKWGFQNKHKAHTWHRN